MSHPHRPRKGSMGYSPRKRSAREWPRIRSWPEVEGEPRVQSFPGWKARWRDSRRFFGTEAVPGIAQIAVDYST